MTFTIIVTALAIGFVPSFIWLYFLLREDARCPEPKRIVALAFFAGMLAVPVAIFFERYAQTYLSGNFQLFTVWAAIEEITKYTLAVLLILWRPEVDEPLDYVIYLITVALGFAALENALYIFTPLSSGHLYLGMLTENVRFLGSTLLHVIASATIGFALAFSYKKQVIVRVFYVVIGVILAITLHTTFNLLIINRGGLHISEALFLVWSGTVVILALFEILKYRTYRNLPANVC